MVKKRGLRINLNKLQNLQFAKIVPILIYQIGVHERNPIISKGIRPGEGAMPGARMIF